MMISLDLLKFKIVLKTCVQLPRKMKISDRHKFKTGLKIWGVKGKLMSSTDLPRYRIVLRTWEAQLKWIHVITSLQVSSDAEKISITEVWGAMHRVDRFPDLSFNRSIATSKTHRLNLANSHNSETIGQETFLLDQEDSCNQFLEMRVRFSGGDNLSLRIQAINSNNKDWLNNREKKPNELLRESNRDDKLSSKASSIITSDHSVSQACSMTLGSKILSKMSTQMSLEWITIRTSDHLIAEELDNRSSTMVLDFSSKPWVVSLIRMNKITTNKTSISMT